MMKVMFSPKDSRIYEAKVPLYLDDNTTQPYYLVHVRGEGQYPRLKFDTRECIMPPVPLGFASKALFHVISQGYDNLQLKVCHAPALLATACHCVQSTDNMWVVNHSMTLLLITSCCSAAQAPDDSAGHSHT